MVKDNNTLNMAVIDGNYEVHYGAGFEIFSIHLHSVRMLVSFFHFLYTAGNKDPSAPLNKNTESLPGSFNWINTGSCKHSSNTQRNLSRSPVNTGS